MRLRRLRPAPVARSTTPRPASGHGEPPVKGRVPPLAGSIVMPGRLEVTPWTTMVGCVVVATKPAGELFEVVVMPPTSIDVEVVDPGIVELVVVDELVDVDDDVVVGIDVDVVVGASVVVVLQPHCSCDVVVTGSVVEVVLQLHGWCQLVVVWLQPLLIAPAS